MNCETGRKLLHLVCETLLSDRIPDLNISPMSGQRSRALSSPAQPRTLTFTKICLSINKLLTPLLSTNGLNSLCWCVHSSPGPRSARDLSGVRGEWDHLISSDSSAVQCRARVIRQNGSQIPQDLLLLSCPLVAVAGQCEGWGVLADSCRDGPTSTWLPQTTDIWE